jgi:threonine/homoserine/homoserine lactone efflux protein
MEFFLPWLLLASVNLAAVISPGPAFALTVRNAIVYNRRTGLMTAIGLGMGVGVIVAIVLGGFAIILTQSALLYDIVRYAGAAYLVYIGGKALMTKKPEPLVNGEINAPKGKSLSDFAAWRTGFLTNITNPKGMVFFTAIFTQFVSPDTPWQILVLYGLTAIVLETGWFSIVTCVLTHARIKQRFLGVSHWIERACGGLLVALGVRLALSKIH